MSVNVLGVSAFYHDSAAALVRDGEIIAAAQEERFSRKKHDSRFPREAINYCLGEELIEPSDLDAVVFFDNPVLSLDRIIKSMVSGAQNENKQGLEEQWISAAKSTLGLKLNVKHLLTQTLKVELPVYFTQHHLAHAASAFYPSPFADAAILTIDGVGEWATTTLGVGEGEQVKILKEIHYPHSLGLLYSAFTSFCGFKVNSGEYKLMGLAPYGKPRFEETIWQHLIKVKSDGSYRLNMKYFGYLDSMQMVNKAFEELFGGPPRLSEARITRREMDIAASIQRVTEEVVLRLATHLREFTNKRFLVLAGGVALNCVANGKLLRSKVFEKLWIQPAAGDAGGALGAALIGCYEKFGVTRWRISMSGRDTQKGSYLGPRFSKGQVRAFLDRRRYPYTGIDDNETRATYIAQAIADGKIVGFFSGRMEFGPRSLGARSILGDPRNPKTQSVMNLKIKYRESFRPFAPTVLLEECKDYFDLDEESPYMLFVAPVVDRRCKKMDWSKFTADDDMLAVVQQERSDIPAVTHVDYSARIQTLSEADHQDFYRVLRAFRKITGLGVLVNTSFNVRGEPIVCSPEDAYRCFMRTEMDLLVLEDCILLKHMQEHSNEDENWRERYELD